MKAVHAISLSGSLDHMQQSSFKDTIIIQAQGYGAREMVLSSNKDLPILLQEGLMDIEVRGLRTAKGLNATLVTTFKSVRMNTGKQDEGIDCCSISGVRSFSL